MKVQNGTCSDVRVAYIGGGSHGWAWTFFKDLDPSIEYFFSFEFNNNFLRLSSGNT